MALDGSPCANHALGYAVGLAKAEGAKLIIYAVVDPFSILGRTPLRPLEEERVAAAKAEADRFVADAVGQALAAGVAAEGCVELGRPALKILDRAAKAVDAVVMGTHGRSGFRRLFMGSVAEAVLRASPCPVLIVREKADVIGVPEAAPSFDFSGPVFAMRLIEVAPKNFERLYGEIASFMLGPGGELPGVVETQIFGSEDETRIMIVAEFCSHADWVHAQWDVRFGELLEEIVLNSETLEFHLYRGDRFRPTPSVASKKLA